MSISSYHKLQRFFSYLEKQKRTMWKNKRLRTRPKCVCLSFQSAVLADRAEVVDVNLEIREVDNAKRKRSTMTQGIYRIEGSFSCSPY